MEEALTALKNGEFVIVTDDYGRENEGDLILAAEMATEEKMAFLMQHTSGITCVSLPKSRLDQLELPQMCPINSDPKKTAFTHSVDARVGTTTGISASDRSKTIRALADEKTLPSDLNRPGHIFPLEAKEGGVLVRPGHTEAALDLMRLAGLKNAAVLSEIMNRDGTVARFKEIEQFAKEWAIPLITIEELIQYRRVTKVSSAKLPTEWGTFTSHVYRCNKTGIEHIVLSMGQIEQQKEVLVRIHSECVTGDVFASRRCDCGSQLHLSLKMISEEGCGLLIYLRDHEGRGIGLGHKLKAYGLQDLGRDTVEANIELGFPPDSRQYSIGASIISSFGIKKVALLTNNPSKAEGLALEGIEVARRVPLIGKTTPENSRYLDTKRRKLGHLL